MTQEITWLPLDRLRPNPKNFFRPAGEEELRELAESIAEHGVIHPIGVWPAGPDFYEIISGHSRFRAIQRLGWEAAPCLVYDVENEAEAELMMIDANLQSRNLSPMEVARAVRRKKELLGERRGRPGKDSHNESIFDGETAKLIGDQLGMSAPQIYRYDKLNDLIPEFQDLVDRGRLGPTLGEQLARFDPEAQRQLFDALGEEVANLKAAEVKKLREEQDRGYAVVLALQKRIDQLEAELAGFKERHGSKEDLEREIARLRQKKKLLEYDIADREQAIKEYEKKARPGAELLDLVDRIGRPVQAALTHLSILCERNHDTYVMHVAQKWADVFERAAALLRSVKEKKAAN